MIHHIKRATRHLIFWSLIAFALGLLGVRLLLVGLDHYKLELADEISKQVEAPVTIGRLSTHFHHFSPQLVLKDIAITTPQKNSQSPPIQLKELRLSVNLIDLLLSHDVLFATRLTLVGAKITVKKQVDGSIAIVGLKAGDGKPLWLLQGRKYQVLQSTVTWQNEQQKSKPLTFDDVNVLIRNDGNLHRFNILMNLQKKQGKSLSLALEVKGNIFEPDAINGTGFIEGKALNLPEWVTVDLPLDLAVKSGVGDFKIWGTWKNSRVQSMTVDVQAKQLHLSQQYKADFISPHLSTLFFWTKNNDEWQFDVERFLLETAEKKYPVSAFNLSGSSSEDKQLHKIALSTQHIDLQQIATLTQFFLPLPDAQAKLFAQAQPKGDLENFTLSADFDNNQLAIDGQFKQLSFTPVLSIPAIDNLSGSIKGSEQQGTLQLNTDHALLKHPQLFRNPIPLTKLNGTLTWQQNTDDWMLTTSMLEVNVPDIQSKSRLQLIIPKAADKPVFMDLQSSFSGNDMSKAPLYYPTAIMSKTLVDWLDHAFIGGKVPKGGFLFYGNLNEFPFTKGQGVFEVLFNAEQLELNYHPDWPHLTELAGEVLFFQDQLQVNLAQGKSDKITIKQADIGIPSLDKGEKVLVQGEFTAGIADTLSFLQKTPLDLSIDKVLDAITPKGDTQVKLELTIPMEDNISAKVDGVATTSNGKLMVNAVNLAIDNLTGVLKFNENGIYTDKLNAVALGYPVAITINNDAQKTTINAEGYTDIEKLSKQFVMSGWSVAAGGSDYNLELQLPYGDKPSELTVQSMLKGITLDLPSSLKKSIEQSRPLTLTFSLVDKPLLPIVLNYDNQLKAALNLDVKHNSLQAGTVLIGSGKVGVVPETGLNLEINKEQLALQEWLGIGLSEAQNTASTQTNTLSINEIKIHSNSALWKKTPLGRFDLSLKPNGKQWAGVLNSRDAKGKLTVPFDLTGANRITLNMEELDFSLFKQLGASDDSAQAIAPTPAAMALLTLTSQKTRWQGVELGELKLATERINNGIAFKGVTLISPLQKLLLSGDWTVNGQKSVTHVLGDLTMIRADELLKQLDINKDFTKTSGAANFDVHWQGAPQQFSIANLQGKLDIELEEGRLLSVEPGMGRMLGVLAVAQWIKRLQLDFSDIYEEGLTFNSIIGHFDLAQGKAHTDNLIVDAVPAKITLIGDTDLLKRTVDYSIRVAPKSADAVPIAGTIMGQVASLIGRSLTGKDQDGFFFGSQYLVTGEWGKVQVIPQHENDGLLQKTWSELTDFSWLNEQKNNQGKHNE